jgi:chromosome partitioning protein
MHVPADTQQLVIDAPAGTSGLLLQEMLGRADGILIPVAPSAIDIHATANFVRDLLLVGRIRTRNIQLAVVANRVRSSMPVYQPLERFLNSLGFPFLTRISDSDVYVKAAEAGIGIFEMALSAAAAECAEFMPIVDWVGRQRESAPSGYGKVVDLASRRWMERTPGLSTIGSRS